MKSLVTAHLSLLLAVLAPRAHALNPVSAVAAQAKQCMYWLVGTATNAVDPLLSRALADPEGINVEIVREQDPESKNAERILKQDYGWDWREPQHKDGMTIYHVSSRERGMALKKGDLVLRYSHDDPEHASAYVVESSTLVGPYVEVRRGPYRRNAKNDLHRYQVRLRNLPDLLQSAFMSTVPTIAAKAQRIEQRLQDEDKLAKDPREGSGRMAL